MKKILLFLPVLLAGLFADAQKAYNISDNLLPGKYLQDRPVGMQSSHTSVSPPRQQRPVQSGARLSTILNSQRISSAGNLLSVLEGACNQLSVIDSLNLVTFIHRNDPYLLANSTVATYRYDISRDRGLNWVGDIGPITLDPRLNNVIACGRFPQAVIYNPAGNNVVDSAYLVYSGTWHENNTWSGQLRGRAQLSGNVNTFTNSIDTINNKHVNIATGMCQSVPGTFWNLNTDYSGTFNAGSNALTTAILIQKGVWNNTTKEVDWTLLRIPQGFVTANTTGGQVSLAYAFTMAFDPSGQYGWIACIGDTTNNSELAFSPMFWKTTNGGQTWSNPEVVDLKAIQGVVERLPKVTIDDQGAVIPASGVPTATLSAALSVDVNGNPHLLTTIGNSNQDVYDIQEGGFTVWDITYDATASAGCKWKGIFLADIATYIGARTSDQPTYSEDNRPMISRTDDGTKIFMFWTDSDSGYLQSTANDAPNMFGRAIDVAQGKMTPLRNFTEGDTLWSGETANSLGGIFLPGASYPTAGPIALQNGNVFNVPVILTQIDYNKTNAGLGSSEQPAAFWYVSNIDFAAADFNLPIDQVPPTVTLNGDDSVNIKVNTLYTEAGATAFDCTDGVVNVTIPNPPDTSVPGKYLVYYIATDAAGNSDTVTRIVVIGDVPVASFTWSFPGLSTRPKFTDQSTNGPTSWRWDFGDGSGTTQQHPFHTFANNGTYNVCLIVKNNYGSDTSCQQVMITGVGINDQPAFSQSINMFPNPSNGKVFITFDGDIAQQLTVTVFNVLGETVIAPVTYKSNMPRLELNMSDMANGLYLVKIASDKQTAIKTLSLNHK